MKKGFVKEGMDNVFVYTFFKPSSHHPFKRYKFFCFTYTCLKYRVTPEGSPISHFNPRPEGVVPFLVKFVYDSLSLRRRRTGKNLTTHNQSPKAHRNDIKKPRKHRHTSTKGLTNHGILKEVVRKMIDVSKRFFELPFDEREREPEVYKYHLQLNLSCRDQRLQCHWMTDIQY